METIFNKVKFIIFVLTFLLIAFFNLEAKDSKNDENGYSVEAKNNKKTNNKKNIKTKKYPKKYNKNIIKKQISPPIHQQIQRLENNEEDDDDEIQKVEAEEIPLSPITLEQLENNLKKIVTSPFLKDMQIGVKVVSLKKGDTIFDYNGNHNLIPASTTKLLTTSAALATLGPSYKFRTTIYTAQKPVNGVVEGDLYVKGGGDPFLVVENLWLIAQEISQSANIKEIKGNIAIDDSFFDNKSYPDSWVKEELLRSFHAPLGAFSVNFNSINFDIFAGDMDETPARVAIIPNTSYVEVVNKTLTKFKSQSSISFTREPVEKGDRYIIKGIVPKEFSKKYYRTVSDPNLYGGTLLKEFLIQQGVKVEGGIISRAVPKKARVIRYHESKDLASIVRDINKYSNNFMAEQLLKTLGAEVEGAPGTTEKGCNVVKKFMEEKVGIPSSSFTIADGSGLSRDNMISPSLLVKLLRYNYSDFSFFPEFISSLGIAKIDGTLKKRFDDYKMSGKVRAKTGTMSGITSLAGYITTLNNEILIFSIIINSEKGVPTYKLKEIEEEICVNLASLYR